MRASESDSRMTNAYKQLQVLVSIYKRLQTALFVVNQVVMKKRRVKLFSDFLVFILWSLAIYLDKADPSSTRQAFTNPLTRIPFQIHYL